MAGGSWQVGGVKITRVVEIEPMDDFHFVLPDAKPEAIKPIAWLRPDFADDEGRMKACIQALVVETPSKRIVVDTCIGNDKTLPVPAWNNLQTRFLEDMIQLGYPAESIDVVLCTHLHVDHVGWNTRLVDGQWMPTFTQARYLFGKKELGFWEKEISENDMANQVFADSVSPVLDAGLADLVETDHVICDEVKLMPTPGHTPGHVSVLVASEGKEALITGDFLHHPCQFAHPEWASSFDEDANQSQITRRALFERYCQSDTLIIGTHFATPSAGYLVRDGDTYKLET